MAFPMVNSPDQSLSILQRLRALSNIGNQPPNAQDTASLPDPALAPTQPQIEDSQFHANDEMMRRTGGKYGFFPSRESEASDLADQTRQNLALGGIAGRQKIAELTAPKTAEAQGALALEKARQESPLAQAQAAEAQANADITRKFANGGLNGTNGPSKVGWSQKGGLSVSQQGTPQQFMARADTARVIRGTMSSIQDEANYLAQKGLIGSPVTGRLSNFIANTLHQPGAAVGLVGGNDKDAAILAHFYQSLELLKSGVTNVHAGMRGAASPALLNTITSGLNNVHSDMNGFNGSMAAVEDMLKAWENGAGLE